MPFFEQKRHEKTRSLRVSVSFKSRFFFFPVCRAQQTDVMEMNFRPPARLCLGHTQGARRPHFARWNRPSQTQSRRQHVGHDCECGSDLAGLFDQA
jgi:hypothetical protein